MWTTEQIIALAPDAASAKNGRALANAAKWQSLGKSEKAVWGECQGSGKNPYQAAIDLREPAFKCSCPSRKFPCKHGLGLFLLLSAQENLFGSEITPAFCADWLGKRDAQKDKKEEKSNVELTVEELAKREKSKAKRAVERETKVAEGLRELEVWLKDLIRQGLAVAKNQPPVYWEKTAKRMIDAQAAGAARMVRELSSALSSGDNWAGNFLAKAGKIHLFVEAYKNLEKLPVAVQFDVKTAIGWTVKEDEVETFETIKDKWFIVGQRVYKEEKLRVQRTWLKGETSRRNALVLDFAYQNQPLDVGLVVGSKVEAEIAFYPGNYPLRAVVKNRGEHLEHFSKLDGYENFAAMLENYAQSVSKNVWLDVFPATLENVVPVVRGDECFLRDGNAALLPLNLQTEDFWRLIAFSGGSAIGVFGEMNGETLRPLRAFGDSKMIIL